MEQQDKYISAPDIGMSKVIALIEEVQEDNEIHIAGLGQAPSRGLKAGTVTNTDATAQAIRRAVNEAELTADTEISHVTTGIADNHIRSLNSQGIVKIKDGEVSQAGIDRAIETAKAVNIPPGHSILHMVVQEYIIDSQPGAKEPIGMGSVRLGTRVHIITGVITALQSIQKCIHRCGLRMDQIMLQPLASGQAVLTEDEKDLGVCVIDIGGGITDIAAYTSGAARRTAIIPVAGDLITKDLAQALRTPHSAAEYTEIHYGVVMPTMDGLDEMVEVPSVGDRQPRQTPRCVLASVIGPRVEEILELTLNELRRSGFPEEVLTLGIVLADGVSMLTGIVELAEEVFNLPAHIEVSQEMSRVSERTRSPCYAIAIGLLQAARGEEDGTAVAGAVAVSEQGPKVSLWSRFQKWLKDNF